MSKINDYTTGNLWDYEYFSNHYKLIAVDLNKQIELENPDLKQIILLVNLKEIKEQQCFLSLKNQKKLLLFFHKILWLSYKMVTRNIINLYIYKFVNLNDSSNKGSYFIDSQTAKEKYNQNNSIKFETKSIKSCLCDYSAAFILLTGDINVTADNNTDVAFKIVHYFLHARQKLTMCLLFVEYIRKFMAV